MYTTCEKPDLSARNKKEKKTSRIFGPNNTSLNAERLKEVISFMKSDLNVI